jgi:oxygen-independent coproporphyrinogen-3 oxidase
MRASRNGCRSQRNNAHAPLIQRKARRRADAKLATMTESQLARLDRPVPRYTSYPTAPHFHAGIDAAAYRAWLGAVGDEASLSLYLHVPFCQRLCWYCGCHTKLARRYAPVADYVRLLEAEIGLVAAALPGRPPVRQIHWGGGTPTVLTPQDFARLTEVLHRHFAVDAAEVAVEIDPRTLTRAMARTLAACGVVRASFGVQDFSPQVQEAINRVQSFEETAAAVDRLRDAGIASVNLDLMYGLPHQAVADVVRTVDLAVRLAPDRLALFGYAHVPWMKKHQRLIEDSALPNGAERFAQAEAAAVRLAAHGYRRIGLDHFARPEDGMAQALAAGRLRRNFQGYSVDEGEVLLGFGASAIGSLPQGYVQNAVPLNLYGEAIESGRLPTARGIALAPEDRLRRAVIERLMCDLAVDLDAVTGAPGAAGRFAAELAALRGMEAEGLVEIAGPRVTVTEAGRPLVRTVCATFDAYLDRGAARHSRAV